MGNAGNSNKYPSLNAITAHCLLIAHTNFKGLWGSDQANTHMPMHACLRETPQGASHQNNWISLSDYHRLLQEVNHSQTQAHGHMHHISDTEQTPAGT